MSEWKKQPLSSLASFQKGRKVDVSKHPVEGYLNYLGATTLVEGGIKDFANPLGGVIAGSKDVLMLWDGERSGLVGKGRSGVVSSTVTKLTPLSSIDSGYLYYYLDFNFGWIQGRRTGTGVPHVPKDLGRILIVEFPAQKNQQRRIAEILSTVDEAIEQTERLIAKQQQIKAGLMQDLFTRGVWTAASIERARASGSPAAARAQVGQLRPPRGIAPELYKESPLGWIPQDWEVKRCYDISKRICVGIVIRPTQYYQSSGVPAFRSANVRESGITLDDLVYISDTSNALLAKSQVKGGDILTVRTGYPGTSAVVPEECSGCNTVDILITTPEDSVLSEYLAAWINSSFGKNQVLSKQGGLAQQHFNVGELRDLLVYLPELAEQEAIVERLGSVNTQLNLNESFRDKLKKQKQGLMQDLLTGKVPVGSPEVNG